MKKLLTIATVTASMFIAGCQSAMMTKPTTTLSDGSVVELSGKPLKWADFCGTPSKTFVKELVLTPRENKGCNDGWVNRGLKGPWQQRNEWKTETFSPYQVGKYEFDADISITKHDDMPSHITIFQVHGLQWGGHTMLTIQDGTLRLRGAWKIGHTDTTIETRISSAPERYLGDVMVDRKIDTPFDWKFDGTVYHLHVKVEYDGTGGHWTHVYVDGEHKLTGYTNTATGKKMYNMPKVNFFKTGIYSQNWFEYTAVLRDVSVRKIK